MSRFRFTTLANEDLQEIIAYLATERSAETAHRFVQSISERCQGIADMPGMGRRREELSPGLRSFPEGNYIIFYRPVEDGVEVVRVLHGARDLDRIFLEKMVNHADPPPSSTNGG